MLLLNHEQRKLVQTLLATVMVSLRQDSTAIDMISRMETTSALPALSRGVLQKRKDAARQSLRLRRLQSRYEICLAEWSGTNAEIPQLIENLVCHRWVS